MWTRYAGKIARTLLSVTFAVALAGLAPLTGGCDDGDEADSPRDPAGANQPAAPPTDEQVRREVGEALDVLGGWASAKTEEIVEHVRGRIDRIGGDMDRWEDATDGLPEPEQQRWHRFEAEVRESERAVARELEDLKRASADERAAAVRELDQAAQQLESAYHKAETFIRDHAGEDPNS